MPKAVHKRLDVKTVAALRKSPGLWHDGDGLYLQVANAGAQSWLLKFRVSGKPREMGLGSLRDVTLAQARDLAEDARRLARQGIDPIAKRNNEKAPVETTIKKTPTFAECYRAWRPAVAQRAFKYQRTMDSEIRRFVDPTIGALPVDLVNEDHMELIFVPIWRTHHDIAARTRSVVERVLRYAKQKKYRSGDNPAALENLDTILTQVEKPEIHFARIEPAHIPRFMWELRSSDRAGARLAEFIILTGARTDAARVMTWDQINLEAKRWTIPQDKTKRLPTDFPVPLNERAMTILHVMAQQRHSDYVFPGILNGQPYGNNTALFVIQDIAEALGLGEVTTHGFRSTFADWAVNSAGVTEAIADAAIGHRGRKTRVQKAYFRDYYYEPRIPLMEAWGAYCMSDHGGR